MVEKGCKKMIEMNIPKQRYCRKCRVARETRTFQLELNNYMSNKDGTSKIKDIMKSFEMENSTPNYDDQVEF